MRHRRRGRKLGRNPNHQRALLRNLASALILTERDAEGEDNAPKVKGRIITTLHKAKEVRPLVEKCITIACRALGHQEVADELAPDAERHTEKWRAWRNSPRWNEWNQAVAPVVAARRRALRLLGSKQAVQILFEEIAPRFADRPGGYTRVLELATPRLGDAGRRAILELVGTHEREQRRSQKPAFDSDQEEKERPEEQETATAEETAAAEAPEGDIAAEPDAEAQAESAEGDAAGEEDDETDEKE